MGPILLAIRIALAVLLLVLAPGTAWMLAIAPRAGWPERVVAGAGLSVALMVIALVADGFMRVPITLTTVVIESLALTGAPLLYLGGRRAWRARNEARADPDP